jgi:glyoxylase-like metal-dependent hydrolase (beta-lactamase superfamily II)
VDELRPGLFTWTGRHPSWTPDEGGPEGWEPEVRSDAYAAGKELVLFDPLVEPSRVQELAGERKVAIVLTCHWHRRSSAELVQALGAPVRAPATKVRDIGVPARGYEPGARLPGGVEAQPGGYSDECTLWIPEHRALVTGDVFLGGEQGFRVQPDSWLAEDLTREGLRERLRPLAELPVELLLPTHGDPVAEDARGVLERALAT